MMMMMMMILLLLLLKLLSLLLKLLSLLLLLLYLQADEELREGKLRFRGGRGEAATYDEPDEVCGFMMRARRVGQNEAAHDCVPCITLGTCRLRAVQHVPRTQPHIGIRSTAVPC
jgi:hypothetical protein